MGTIFSGIFAALARLTLPVLALIAAYGIAFASRGESVSFLDGFIEGRPGAWVTGGHLYIMLAFFVSMLTNRAFGPAYAFAQLVLAWLVVGALGFYLASHPQTMAPVGALPRPQTVMAFVSALFAAHIANILIYDRMRGVPWWRAPLVGGIAAAIVLPALYWSLTRMPGTPWMSNMTLDIALKATAAMILLAPFTLLRAATRPRNGFGGY